jgi:hypothetical protein
MKTRLPWWIIAVLVLGLLPGPVHAQAPHVVAVADFVDDTADGLQIGAVGLSADLQTYLAQRAGNRLRVIPVAEVRAVMRARGYTPADLVSPTRSAEIARAVEADWLVTGRWHYLDLERKVRLGVPRGAFAQAIIDIRVLEVATRRVLLSDMFSGTKVGMGNTFLLRQAAQGALQQAATSVAGL